MNQPIRELVPYRFFRDPDGVFCSNRELLSEYLGTDNKVEIPINRFFEFILSDSDPFAYYSTYEYLGRAIHVVPVCPVCSKGHQHTTVSDGLTKSLPCSRQSPLEPEHYILRPHPGERVYDLEAARECWGVTRKTLDWWRRAGYPGVGYRPEFGPPKFTRRELALAGLIEPLQDRLGPAWARCVLGRLHADPFCDARRMSVVVVDYEDYRISHAYVTRQPELFEGEPVHLMELTDFRPYRPDEPVIERRAS